MLKPVMNGNKTWEAVGSFLRPGLRMRAHPHWKVFWTPNGYQLIDGETTVRFFKFQRDAKRYAVDVVSQSSRKIVNA